MISLYNKSYIFKIYNKWETDGEKYEKLSERKIKIIK